MSKKAEQEAKEIHYLALIEANRIAREQWEKGYEQAEKDIIARIRGLVKLWMPDKNGDEHTNGERLAFNSVLHLLDEMEEE